MKKILSLLSTISLLTTISTSIIACKQTNTSNIENKIKQPPKNSNWKLINDYDWLKNNFDNKFYFVIWKQSYSNKWEIKKFKHDSKYYMGIETYIKDNRFKGLYRWDGDGEPQTPEINKETGEIKDWNEKIES
jgi:hypothetical protein